MSQSRSLELVASAIASPVYSRSIFSASNTEAEGLIEIEVRDCYAEIEVYETTDQVKRSYRSRLGPAGSKALYRVDGGAGVQVTRCALLSGQTADPHTGLHAVGTAAPKWRVRWVPRTPPRPIPPHLQIGGAAYFDVAAIAAGATQIIGWPPAYSRKASILVDQPAALHLVDPNGDAAGSISVVGETTIELDPWNRLSLENLGASSMRGRILWMLMAGGAG